VGTIPPLPTPGGLGTPPSGVGTIPPLPKPGGLGTPPPSGVGTIPPLPPPGGGVGTIPPLPTPGGVGTPPSGVGTIPPLPTPGGLGTPPAGGVGTIPPLPTPGGLGAPPASGVGTIPPLPTPSPFAKDGDNRPLPPPAPGTIEFKPVKPFDDKTPIPDPPKPAPFDPVGGVIPPRPLDPAPAPGPLAVIPPTGGVLLPAPPIIVGGVRPSVAVTEVSTDFYECQKGDTTFAILSLRMYGTDKYADALLKYNRDHSGVLKNGSALNINPPILNPGQQVQKPPQAVLERDYRALIRTNAAPPQVRMDAPTPLTPSIPPGPIAKVSNPPTTGPGGTYTVQNPGGESILDIAERVFGDRSQWHKIYRVNPNYPPQNRIPAGTTLTLPSS
jgi:hypothetical protein